jgi:hypothetical protein
LGVTGNISLPPLIGSKLTIPIPGLHYTVPIVGVQLNISVEVAGSLIGRGAVTGNATGGAGPLSWNNSSSSTFQLTAGPSPGTIVSSLVNVAYDWSLGLDAGGCVPLLGCYNVTLLPYFSLGSFTGSVNGVHATYVAVADPTLATPQVNPPHPTPGGPVTVSVKETGGVGNIQVTYAGIPANCSLGGTTSIDCATVPGGVYVVNVTAVDQEAQEAHTSVTFTVTPAAAAPGTPVLSSDQGGVPLLYWLGLGGLLVVIAVLAVLLLRRPPARTRGGE